MTRRSWSLLAGGTALGALALALVVRGPLPHAWLALGVLGAVLSAGAARLHPLLAGKRLRLRAHSIPVRSLLVELACIAVLVAITCVLLPGGILGDRPVSKDHTVHFMKALETRRLLLSHGEILGWSHRFFAGYPHNFLYPPGADLLVVAVHVATLGLASMSAAYGVAVWLTIFGGAYAVYRFGAAAFDRRAGLVAGVAVLLDGGAFDQGGWSFMMGWGVWPQSLAVTLLVLAASRLPAVMNDRRLVPIAAFAALTGASIVTHPLLLVFTAILAAAAALAWALTAERPLSPVPLLRLAAGAVLGVLLSAFWLLPFATSAADSTPFGKAWAPAARIAAGLLDGGALRGLPPLVLGAGLVGVAGLLAARRFLPLLTALLALIPLVAAATDVLQAAGLGWLPQRLQLVRFAMLAKPFLFVAAGFAIVSVFDRVREMQPSVSGVRRHLATFAVLTLAAPLLLPAATALLGRLDRRPVMASTRPYAADMKRLRAYAAGLPLDPGMRWANLYRFPERGPNHDGAFDALGDVDAPVFRPGYLAASTYRLNVDGRTADVLRLVNVRYVLANDAMGPGFRELARFGPFVVSELEGWRREPFDVVDGAGEVDMLAWTDEEMVLRAGPGATGRLRLAVSSFPRWRAERDGQPVPISELPLPGVRGTGFMTVPLAAGTYRLEFRTDPLDRAGQLATLAGVLACLGMMAADRRRSAGEAT